MYRNLRSRRKGDDDDSVVPADVASHPPSGDADACDDIDATRRRTREGLDDDLRGGRHHDAEGRYERIVRAFEVERSGHHGLLTDRHLVDMFHFLVNRDVILSYEVLRLYAIRCERDGKLVGLDMYQRIINRIRSHHRPRHRRPHSESTEHDASNSEYDPTPRKMRSGELNRLIRDMTRHIQETYSNGTKRIYRHMLLPELAVAVMESNVDVVKCHAASIMNYVLERDDDFPVLDPELYEMLLSKGRRGGVVVGETGGRDGHFPYRKLLSRLVSSGHVPTPETVATVLQCYHPFDDTDATHEILSIIQKLQLDIAVIESPPVDDYRIDLGTLEAISMASARKNVDLTLLVWDLVELFGYAPTAGMFEDVIMSFAATYQDENMFSALADMERNGFVPSPGLLKFVGMKISRNDKRIRHSYNTITWRGNAHMLSRHCMNALIIGHGMKRDIDNAFFVFENFARLNLRPDANTFSFLMEALYIDTKSRFPFEAGTRPTFNPQDVDDVVAAAQIILDSIDESGVKKTKSFFYEHIRLLYTLGLLEEAKSAIEEAVSTGTAVPMASLFVLASRFALLGDFESARAVSGLSIAAGCGDFPRLTNRIKNLENNFNILKGS